MSRAEAITKRLAASERIVFVIGVLALLVLMAWPTVGSLPTRAMPPEVDDTLFYLLRGQYLLECPREDCIGAETIRAEFDKMIAEHRGNYEPSYQKFVFFSIHAPLHVAFIGALRTLGLDWMTAQWAFIIAGIVIITCGIALWLRSAFGEGPAGLAALLVGTTYFVGQGLIWIVPSNVALGLGLLACGLAVSLQRRAAVWLAILFWMIVFMHVTGRGIAVLAMATYVIAIGPPWQRRDLVPLLSGILAIGLYTALPLIFSRPDFHTPFGYEGFTGNPLDVIIGNIIETDRVTLRTTSIAGGFIGMAVVAVIALIALPPGRRRPVAAFLVLGAGFCVLSLVHINPRIPAELFARLWVLIAVTLTGAAAFVLWKGLPYVFLKRTDVALAVNGPTNDGRAFLSSDVWRLLAAVAYVGLALGAIIHVAAGLYLIERARIMVAGRHDFAFNREQPAMLLKDGCGTVGYSRQEAVHIYWLYGAMRCKSRVAMSTESLSRIGDLSHAVVFSQMAQFQGWQPISSDTPFTIRNREQAVSPCTAPVDRSAPVHALLRTRKGTATVLVRNGTSQQQVTVDATPRWVDLGPLPDQNSAFVLQPGTGQAEIGGLRRGTPGNLLWPWDQGLEAEFVRDVRYQYRNAIKEPFATAAQFNAGGRCTSIMDDHGLTLLLRIANN
jgi:hypothetical protein